MSLRFAILQELSAKPSTVKMLKNSLKADERKIKRTLKALMVDNKVTGVNGVYRVRPRASANIKAKVAKQYKGQPIEATFVKLGKSFGFAVPKDGTKDIFVPGRSLNGAMPGDIVLIELFAHPRVQGSREGAIQKILVPNNRLVGTVVAQGSRLALIPDNCPDLELPIKKGEMNGAVKGEKVAAEIVFRGKYHGDHQVKVLQSFGPADLAKDCSQAIVYGAGIEKEFPPAVLRQAKEIAEYSLSTEEIEKRVDLRENVIFTIDAASTKDIDDAISLEKTNGGYTLGVHIADVSHYVTAKSPLDEDAMQRATSVYYANQVVPMLPKELSNGICSLNAEEDRLAFSCIMQLNKEGKLLAHTFQKTVIRSCIKGVYSEINTILNETASGEIEEKYIDVKETLFLMQELYEKLATLRAERGNMEIQSEEAYLQIDETGKCVGIERRERGVAERLIEEFMLLANQSAAMKARKLEIPFVYRVHEKPSPEKVEQLKIILHAAGISATFAGDEPTPTELGQILDETRGTTLERFVHTGILRSMSKAKYEPLPKGHYGLALEDYAHFTSPIRRYPDLAIHRILTDLCAGMKAEEIKKKYESFAQTASQISSEKELVAQRVERDCDDCYKAEYMKQYIGEEFTGIISSVVQFGVYVQLENSVEGMIHVSKLSEGHTDLVDGIALVDPLSGKSFKIGDSIKIKVENVNVSRGLIDFDLVEE